MPRFFLTTAIDYVNSRPHLGHALEKIAADVIARYKRLAGFDVRFVMGNDEHSQNVYRRARELGLDPLVYCDQMEQQFRDVWTRLDISFDDFIRTTQPRHRVAVESAAAAFLRGGRHLRGPLRRLVLRVVRGLQAGEGPGRRALSHPSPGAGVDQGTELLLSIVGLSGPATGPLSRSSRSSSCPKSRRNEMLRVLEGGLEDISVSRAGQAWGIPLPFDPTSVVYVWYDALVNYIAAVGYGADDDLFERLVAGGSPPGRQGHHPLPLRRLARDADERRASRCHARCSGTDSCCSRARR